MRLMLRHWDQVDLHKWEVLIAFWDGRRVHCPGGPTWIVPGLFGALRAQAPASLELVLLEYIHTSDLYTLA